MVKSGGAADGGPGPAGGQAGRGGRLRPGERGPRDGQGRVPAPERGLRQLPQALRAGEGGHEHPGPGAHARGAAARDRQLPERAAAAGVRDRGGAEDPRLLPGPVPADGRELQEAIMREESDEVEDGHVLEEFRRGFTFKGALLRAAMVKVAMSPAAPAAAEEGGEEAAEEEAGDGDGEAEE